jgi:hypothetical protein
MSQAIRLRAEVEALALALEEAAARDGVRPPALGAK